MKVIYYFGDQDTIMHRWPAFHFYDELSRYGVDVELFNPLKFPTLEDANSALIRRIEEGDVSLFITPHNHERLFIDTLKKIKIKGVPTLLKCYDNLTAPFFHKKIAPFFDLVWLTSIETEDLFCGWGANTIFLPYAANPFNFKHFPNIDNGKMCFIGTPYGSRVNMINAITDSGFGIDLYSGLSSNMSKIREFKTPSFESIANLMKFSYGRKIILGAVKQKINQPDLAMDKLSLYPNIDYDEMSRIYSNYAISLSSTAARNTGVLSKPLHVINLRAFEIPMSGGLQMCSFNPELAEYFKEDEEIIFYRNNKELQEKMNYYLKEENYDLRIEMKKKARLRAENEHSWIKRYEIIFKRMNIKFPVSQIIKG